MVCNLLDIRCKIRMWVSIHDTFVSNVGIAKCLNQYVYHWMIHRTLPFFLCACVSLLFTKFSLSSIDWTLSWRIFCRHKPDERMNWEVMLKTLYYRPVTQLQHPNTIGYCENSYLLPVDMPHTEMHISPQLIMNSVWTLSTQPSLSRSQIYRFLQILNAAPILCHVVTSNARTFTHNDYI